MSSKAEAGGVPEGALTPREALERIVAAYKAAGVGGHGQALANGCDCFDCSLVRMGEEALASPPPAPPTVDTYTATWWASLTDEERWAEFVKLRGAAPPAGEALRVLQEFDARSTGTSHWTASSSIDWKCRAAEFLRATAGAAEGLAALVAEWRKEADESMKSHNYYEKINPFTAGKELRQASVLRSCASALEARLRAAQEPPPTPE